VGPSKVKGKVERGSVLQVSGEMIDSGTG
jgi:hypothetical protein